MLHQTLEKVLVKALLLINEFNVNPRRPLRPLFFLMSQHNNDDKKQDQMMINPVTVTVRLWVLRECVLIPSFNTLSLSLGITNDNAS